MTVAVEGDVGGFTVARMASRALDAARIAVAGDMNGGLSFAIADVDFCNRHRRLHHGIGVEHNLYAQPMVFNFFGNFAVEIGFERASLLARGVMRFVDLFDLLPIVGGEAVERLIEARQNFGLVGDTAQVGVIDGIFAG